MQDILTAAIEITAIFPFVLFAVHLLKLTLDEMNEWSIPYEPQPEPETETIAEPQPSFKFPEFQPIPVRVRPLPVGSNVVDYGKMTVKELRNECTHRNIVWRNANGKNKHLTKAQMVKILNE